MCEKISNQQIKIHAIKKFDKTKLRKNVVHDLRDNKTSCRLDTIVYPCKKYFYHLPYPQPHPKCKQK